MAALGGRFVADSCCFYKRELPPDPGSTKEANSRSLSARGGGGPAPAASLNLALEQHRRPGGRREERGVARVACQVDLEEGQRPPADESVRLRLGERGGWSAVGTPEAAVREGVVARALDLDEILGRG